MTLDEILRLQNILNGQSGNKGMTVMEYNPDLKEVFVMALNSIRYREALEEIIEMDGIMGCETVQTARNALDKKESV